MVFEDFDSKRFIPCIIPLNTGSAAYRRVTAAGFKIHRVLMYRVTDRIRDYQISWECVCNRLEGMSKVFLDYEMEILIKIGYFNENGEIDAARMIEESGSVSEKHLRDDGFSEQQIRMIRAPYENEMNLGFSQLSMLAVKDFLDIRGYAHG